MAGRVSAADGPSEVKTCRRCRRPLCASQFYKRRASTDGLDSWCKECRRDWNRKHPEIRCTYRRNHPQEWRKRNKEKESLRLAAYRANHREYYAKKKAEYDARNPEKVLAAHRSTHAKYREKYNMRSKLRNAVHCKHLSDVYITAQLTARGISREKIMPEMIELKRAIIQLKRAMKEGITNGKQGNRH